MQTYNIVASPFSNPTGTPVVRAGSQSALIRNADPTSQIFLSFSNSIDATTLSNAIALNAGGVIVVDGSRDVYVTTGAATGTTPVQVIEGGISFFQPTTRITAGQFVAQGPGSGVFVYTGIAGPGNPPIAWVSNSALDPFGQTLPVGVIVAYNPVSHAWGKLFGGQVQVYNGTDFQEGIVDGTASGTLSLFSAQVSNVDTQAIFQLLSKAASGIGVPEARFSGTNVVVNGGSISDTLASGFSGTVPVSQTDSSSNTANTASFSPITKQWDVPINDANVATTYHLKARFSGTQATTTAVSLLFNVTAFGVSICQISFPATFAAAGTGFVGTIEGDVEVSVTGAVATITGDLTASIRQSGTATNTVQTTVQTSTTANTSIDQKIFFNAEWSSVANAPTVTCSGSTFTRLGVLQ